MINYKAGAWRPLNTDARLTAANELVQRTLAENGILSAPLDKSTGPSIPTPPSSGHPFSNFNSFFEKPPVQNDAMPHGAEFRQDRFSCAAGARDYRTYLPSTAASGVTGVVVMLHGCTQTAEDFAIGTGLNALAEQHGFVVIYPQQSRGDNAQSCWNWFSKKDQQRDLGEPAILAGIARHVAAEHNVPDTRAFVAGLSAGAAMAVILGDTYPDVFCAVGAHSGLPFGAAKDVPSAFTAMAGQAPEPRARARNSVKLPTIIFHGTTDTTVHPSNGDRIARHVVDQSPPGTIEMVEQGTSAGRSFDRTILTTSDGATLMEHWSIDGLGHAWSGGQPGGSYTEANGPDASTEMIRFFLDVGDASL